MDDTTKRIIERITVRSVAPRTLPNGESCSVFYDCIRLTPNDLARLAAEATGDLDESVFDMSVGLAYTGIFFASAIAGGRPVGIVTHDGSIVGPEITGQRIVLVDDVVSSGTRLLEATRSIEAHGAQIVGYACIVDRSGGKFGTEQRPLWSAHQTIME